MENQIYSNEILVACSSLLLSVADADEILEEEELETISEILMDFFQVDKHQANQILEQARTDLDKSLGLFELGKLLNQEFSHADKIEFIKCVYEVGYSDGELHYLEHHTIKKIADILNVEHSDLISAKIEVKGWFDDE